MGLHLTSWPGYIVKKGKFRSKPVQILIYLFFWLMKIGKKRSNVLPQVGKCGLADEWSMWLAVPANDLPSSRSQKTLLSSSNLFFPLQGMKRHKGNQSLVKRRMTAVRERGIADAQKKARQAQRILGDSASISAKAWKTAGEVESLTKEVAQVHEPHLWLYSGTAGPVYLFIPPKRRGNKKGEKPQNAVNNKGGNIQREEI